MNLSTKQKIFYSAGIEICSDLGLLKKDTNSTRLGPINMLVLVTLLENQGKVLSRNDIFDNVWKNQVVSDDTLTKCISDLRSQLKILLSTEKLIETIPKKGYRWLPEVSMEPQELEKAQELQESIETTEVSVEDVYRDPNDIKNAQYLIPAKKGNNFGIWVASLFISLTLLIFLLFISVKEFSKVQQIRVALVHHDISNEEHGIVTEHIEDVLKTKLLATTNIRFLSSSIIDKHKQNIYPRLSREFSIQWIIEVKLRNTKDKLSISLNLVDARTGIVHESISSDITLKQQNVEPLIDQFILLLITNSD